MPTLRDPVVGCEPRPPQVIVRTEHSQLRFEKDLAAALEIARIDLIGDVLTPALLERLPRRLAKSTGRCACGRKALVLARCRQCAQDAVLAEAEESGETAGVAALAGVRGNTREGLLVGTSTQRVTPAFLEVAYASLAGRGSTLLDDVFVVLTPAPGGATVHLDVVTSARFDAYVRPGPARVDALIVRALREARRPNCRKTCRFV